VEVVQHGQVEERGSGGTGDENLQGIEVPDVVALVLQRRGELVR